MHSPAQPTTSHSEPEAAVETADDVSKKAVLMMQAVGWLGSALLVSSLVQSRALRLRILNLIASVVLLIYNAGIGAVPQIALNAVLALINLWKILELRRTPSTLGASRRSSP